MDANGERLSRLRQRMTAVIIKNEQILLIKRMIYADICGVAKLQNVFWTMPGGGQKSGETPIMALRREIRDETTIKITRERPLFEVRDVPMPPGIPEIPNPPHQDEYFFLVDRWDGNAEIGEELRRKMQLRPTHRYAMDWVPVNDFLWKPNLRDRVGARRLAEFLKVSAPLPLPSGRVPSLIV